MSRKNDEKKNSGSKGLNNEEDLYYLAMYSYAFWARIS